MAARTSSSDLQTAWDYQSHPSTSRELTPFRPPTYGGPFQKADFGYWGKLLVWNCFEAGLLTCGYEPRLLLDVDEDEARESWPAAAEVVERRWRLIDAECHEQGGAGPMAPLRVLDWLHSIEEPYPPELRDVVTRIGAKRISPLLSEPVGVPKDLPAVITSGLQRSELAEANRPLPSQTKKFHTHQRLLLAMALDRYGYDPAMPRNSAASEIMRSSELYGLRVTDDTIRTALREAFDEHGTA